MNLNIKYAKRWNIPGEKKKTSSLWWDWCRRTACSLLSLTSIPDSTHCTTVCCAVSSMTRACAWQRSGWPRPCLLSCRYCGLSSKQLFRTPPQNSPDNRPSPLHDCALRGLRYSSERLKQGCAARVRFSSLRRPLQVILVLVQVESEQFWPAGKIGFL